ncbi:MAG: ATP-binding protein [Candidatus Limnocylindria bacterium]
MNASITDGRSELETHLEDQMRAQERQLAWVRLGLVLVGALLVVVYDPLLPLRPVLLVVLAVVGLSSLASPWLSTRFPAREVGIVTTALDMAAVSVVVYAAGDSIDAYLFYGLVILGAALRFGLAASIWSSVVMSGLYASVVLTMQPDIGSLQALQVRIAYLVGVGVVAGLFSRVVISRAMENALLQQRLAEDERDAELARERELLSRLGRDFAASLDREATADAVAEGAAAILGEAAMVVAVDESEHRLRPIAARGRDPELSARWRSHLEGRPPRVGEGIIGSAAGTGAAVEAGRNARAAGDPDGIVALDLGWVLAVPILAGGRLQGVLATTGRAGDAAGDDLHRLAEAVAERAGPALQNAQLWSDLQDRMEREQAAQRIKDDFLSIVSHELRTPLTSIQGYSQLLEGRLRTDRSGESKEMAHLRVIRSQVGRMRRLVDDLLDVSRIDRRGGVSIETTDFDLAEQLRDAVSRTQREHEDRDITLAAPESLSVHADRDRIDQVLSNLLENAVKYSPDGGPVVVNAEVRGGDVEVRVADSGVGIPEEHRANVFERFYQADDDAGRRRFGGLGLGLYISRAIVDAHGGRMWVGLNAEAGRGSVFGFRIPRVAMPESSPTVGIAPTGEPPPFVMRHRTD